MKSITQAIAFVAMSFVAVYAINKTITTFLQWMNQ